MALTCISSMATRNLLNALAAEYLASSASRVDIESVGGVEAAKRVLNGEPFDIVILASDALPPLADAGRIDRASLVEVVRSSLAVAVKAGAPAPDVSSEAGLRDAVRCASSVGYSTGPSGAHVLRLLHRWGVADGETEVRRPRLVQAQPGTPVGSLVASGEVDIGFQQFSELKDIEGIEVLCPLPSPVGLATVFSAAITSGCTTPEAAKAFLTYIASPKSASTKRIHGMEPA